MSKIILTAPAGAGHSETPTGPLARAEACDVTATQSSASEIRRVYEEMERRGCFREDLPQRVAWIFGTSAEYVRQIVGR